MHIFLTGASGYVGSRVALLLIEQGHSVSGLVRRVGSAPTGVTEVVGDLTDLVLLTEQASAADAVVHTAFGHDADFAESVNVEKAAVDVIVSAAGTKRVVLTSAAGVLGDTGAEPATDTAEISADFPANIRGFVENITRENGTGANTVTLRLPVVVYGHGGSQFAPLYVAAAMRDGISRYVGTGDNKLAAVHVDDAAQAYLTALVHGQPGSVYNVSSETVTGQELAQVIALGAGANNVDSVDLAVMQEATHPFAALLTSMNFDLDAAGLRELGWLPTGPSVREDIGHGSYKRGDT